MSPEQANGDRELDHRADLWSLGIVTIECLTGKRPYESAGLGNLLVKIVSSPVPELAKLDPDLPVGLADWWKKALAHDPAERFQSADELVETLRPHLLGQPSRPWPSEPVPLPAVQASTEPRPSGSSSVDPLMTTHSPRPSFLRRQRFGVIAALALSAAAAALVLRAGWGGGSSQLKNPDALAVAAGLSAPLSPEPEPTVPEASAAALVTRREGSPAGSAPVVAAPPAAPATKRPVDQRPIKTNAAFAGPTSSRAAVASTSSDAGGAAGSQNLPEPTEKDLGRRLGF